MFWRHQRTTTVHMFGVGAVCQSKNGRLHHTQMSKNGNTRSWRTKPRILGCFGDRPKKTLPLNTTIFKSCLCARLQWRNRLARRTYKQYKAAKRWFLSHAEVVSSSLTWSIGFRWLLISKTKYQAWCLTMTVWFGNRSYESRCLLGVKTTLCFLLLNTRNDIAQFT